MSVKNIASALLIAVFTVLASSSQLAAAQSFLYGLNGGVDYTPGHPVRLSYSTDPSAGALHVALYAISADQAISLYRRAMWRIDPSDVSAGRLVTEFESTDRLDAPNAGGSDRLVDLGMLPIGLYGVVVRSGASVVTQLVDVTTLGLVVNGAGSRHSIWSVDLRTFQHHDGPTQVWVSGWKTGYALSSDPSGIALLPGRQAADCVVVARTADGSLAIEPLEWRTWARQGWWGNDVTGDVGYLQADRPVYRPGQQVHFRAILRDGYIGSYTVPHGERRVQIRDQDGRSIYDERLALNGFGSLHGDALLPDDARLGNYVIMVDNGPERWISVQAYKKPEYEIALAAEKQWILAGTNAHFTFSAKYLFGRPAAGMHVSYSPALDSNDPLWTLHQVAPGVYPSPLPHRDLAAVETRTTGDGTVSIDIPTSYVPLYAQSLSLRVDGRDDSGRTVSTSASVSVEPALFALRINTGAGSGGYAGDPIRVSVQTTDNPYGGPLAIADVPVDLEIFSTEWTGKGMRLFDRSKRTVRTGADGETQPFDFVPPRAGEYEVVVTARDRLGNRVLSTAGYSASARNVLPTPSPDPGPSVSLNKDWFAPGERPRVTVALAQPDRDVLVTVFADGLFHTQVLHVASTSASVDVDVPNGARSFGVSAQLPTETGVNVRQTGGAVGPWDNALTLSLKPNKGQYAPGDPARFDLAVTDRRGRPVRAEIAIGVVDQAIYDVAYGDFGDPGDAFFARNNWPGATRFSWFLPNATPAGLKMIANARSAGGGFQPSQTIDSYTITSAQAVQGGIGAIALRSNLLDTAFWSATVTTDANGRAHVAFPWPDNLTTWVAFATAVTSDTRFASAQVTALVTKNFLVRLALPRFLRKNDVSQAGGIVHGKADAPNVTLQFDAGRLARAPADATLRLNDVQSASVSWPLFAGRDLGEVELGLRGTDAKRTDGVRVTLPIEADGPAEHRRNAGSLPFESAVRLSLPPGYDAGTLHVTFAPSILARLIDAVTLLDVYPYYCTEQTMSAALPALFVQRAAARAHRTPAGHVTTRDVIEKAIARLTQLQHPDGSWGWWEHDAAHPFMTAYAMYGLVEFRNAGFPVSSSTFDRGVASLVSQMKAANGDTLRLWGGAQPGSEWNTRAFMLFALASAAPGSVDRSLLEATDARAASLNAYALAVLGLAHHELGDDATARVLLARLDARATGDGDYTYWNGATWHYAWEDDPIETTAYALRLNAELDPHAAIVRRIANFLLAQQRGSWWYTTKDTAAAIYAVSESIDPAQAEFAPDETVRVRIDGRIVRELHVTTALLSAAQSSLVLPGTSLHDGTVVSFERQGTGSLYWSTDFVRYAPPAATQARDSATPLFERIFPRVPDLAVERRYAVRHPGAWRVGDEIAVDVTVRVRDAVQYVAVEDPFPAGSEYQPDQGDAAWNWSGVQFFDDRAVFFASDVTPRYPLHLHYVIRVTTPGEYAAPAPIAYAMYGPPLSAVGRSQRVTIVEP